MPIYEYRCEDCEQRAEILIRGSEEPVCPQCGGKQLHKEWSTFATGGEVQPRGGGHQHSAGCGCCMGAQGACGLN